jgi:hypothetical protein
VNFMRGAESAFDRFTLQPTAARQRWMREHYWRMRTYAPYFDARLDWNPNAWTYKDAYAIHPGSSLPSADPRFVLRDAAGRRLYIPWGCANGTCPQYAGDIGNPAFRAAWIAEARRQLVAGYKGLYVDDVNMYMQVSDGRGELAAPVDPRTRAPMRPADWRRYMADFMQEVREAFGDREIVHNVIWFAGDDDPQVRRQLRAADFSALERGINDAGIVGGGGQFGFRSFLAYVEARHADGNGVVYDSRPLSAREREYGLAFYLLASGGRDAIGADVGGTPRDWWGGYDTDLGEARGRRRLDGGVWRRDFAGGTVLVNEPGAPARTVAVGPRLRRLDGRRVSSVRLGPAAGAVLVRAGGSASRRAQRARNAARRADRLRRR